MDSDSVEHRLRQAADSVAHTTAVSQIVRRARTRARVRQLATVALGLTIVAGVAIGIAAIDTSEDVVAGPSSSLDDATSTSRIAVGELADAPFRWTLAAPVAGGSYWNADIDGSELYVANGSTLSVIDANLDVIASFDLPGFINDFDVSGDRILASLTRRPGSRCSDDHPPTLFQSLDDGRTWSAVESPWGDPRGRLADSYMVTVAVNSQIAVAARYPRGVAMVNTGCLLELGGYDPEVLGVWPEVDADGVRYLEPGGGSTRRSWSDLGLSSDEIDQVRSATALVLQPDTAPDVVLVGDLTAAPTELGFEAVWSSGGSIVGVTGGARPGSSTPVAVSVDGASWEPMPLFYNGGAMNGASLVTDHNQPTGDHISYSLDGGVIWNEVERPSGAQVSQVVEVPGFRFAYQPTADRISWMDEADTWQELDLADAVGATGSLELLGTLGRALIVSVRLDDSWRLVALTHDPMDTGREDQGAACTSPDLDEWTEDGYQWQVANADACSMAAESRITPSGLLRFPTPDRVERTTDLETWQLEYEAPIRQAILSYSRSGDTIAVVLDTPDAADSSDDRDCAALDLFTETSVEVSFDGGDSWGRFQVPRPAAMSDPKPVGRIARFTTTSVSTSDDAVHTRTVVHLHPDYRCILTESNPELAPSEIVDYEIRGNEILALADDGSYLASAVPTQAEISAMESEPIEWSTLAADGSVTTEPAPPPATVWEPNLLADSWSDLRSQGWNPITSYDLGQTRGVLIYNSRDLALLVGRRP